MNGVIQIQLEAYAIQQGLSGTCEVKVCRTCGSSPLPQSSNVGEPLDLHWEFMEEPCEFCLEIQSHHPKLFHWIGRVVTFDPVYRQHTKEEKFKAAYEPQDQTGSV